MSDIKQQILDELENKLRDSEDEMACTLLDYPKTAAVNYRAGLLAAEKILIDHLEGMVIVSAEPTEEMLDRGYDISDAGAELRDVYKFMIGTLEESK